MLTDLLYRLRAFFRRDAVEGELDEELRFHFDRQVEKYVKSGLSRAEALRQARLAFGGLNQVKEECREARGLTLIETSVQDLRYTLRGIRHNFSFTVVVVLVIALGMGVNTALFSVVHAVLLRPLPYHDSERLVRVWSSMPANGWPRSGSALPDYRAWRAENHTFADLGAYHGIGYNLTGPDYPEQLDGTRLTANLWSVLRVRPMLGNLFTSAAEEWGRHRVALLSERLWRRRFGGDPGVVGRTIVLNQESYTVIGVMAVTFQFPWDSNEIWTPISYPPGDIFETRSNHFVDVLGRLKPGITLSQAQADLSVIAAQIAHQVPENAGLGVIMAGLQESMVGDVRPALMLLLGAVGFVLLIACANVASLLLARATVRQKELTVRVALGASRGRLLRQLLTESLLLAALGTLLGLGLGYAFISLLPKLAASSIPRVGEVSIDGTVLAFTTALAVLAGLVFGLWPAWQAAAIDVNESLKESARSTTSGQTRGRVRRSLVVAEVSLSLVLLVGAGLLILSLIHLQQVDAGFRPDHLLTMRITLPDVRYHEPDRIAGFVNQTVAGLAALPGVSAAGVTTALPLGDREWGKFFSIDGRSAPASLGEVPNVSYREVTPAYFRAMGSTLRRGRLFTAQDGPRQPGVAIINETVARRFWPDDDPLGKRICVCAPESLIRHLLPKDFRIPWLTVVGIVADLRQNGPEQPAQTEVFVPFVQAGEETSGSFFLVARTTSDPLGYASAARAVIRALDPNQPVADLQTMESRLATSLASRRFTMLLLGLFAGMALVLALVGLYGLMAYTMNQRRHEMGIRAALGAKPGDLLRLAVGQGLRLATIGVALGLAMAGSLSHLIESQLFEVKTINPALYAGTALLLLAFAALASWVPGWRASRVDPATTLRHS
jgi:putative ABC transport system permease protein